MYAVTSHDKSLFLMSLRWPAFACERGDSLLQLGRRCFPSQYLSASPYRQNTTTCLGSRDEARVEGVTLHCRVNTSLDFVTCMFDAANWFGFLDNDGYNRTA